MPLPAKNILIFPEIMEWQPHGSGDVLTGIIAGLMAQKVSFYEAACLGVYIHGLAGDMAAEKTGYYSLMAEDIVEAICGVLSR